MTASPAWALQKALFAKLSASDKLTVLLKGKNIYDDVPQQAAFPYLTLGDIRTLDWSTQTRRGHEHRVTLHAWSRQPGRGEIQAIIAAVDHALDDAALGLEDHNLVNLRTIFWHALRETDGRTYHGIVRLRAVTEPESPPDDDPAVADMTCLEEW
ncbi:MAG: DUF3168 domain-containing protein [Hyphomicrobiales bacterium]